MSGFEQLARASAKLENSLQNAIVNAVSYSEIETIGRSENDWEEMIRNKLIDLKVLSSKASLLHATIKKNSVPVIDGMTSDESKFQLRHVIDTHNRWNNALKIKAISRAVYLAYKNNDEEKTRVFKEMLQKLSDLDRVLDKLNSIELVKNKELNDATQAWKTVAKKWDEKKKLSGEKCHTIADSDDDSKRKLHKYIVKMETMKNIQGRLLGSSISYDWIKNPNKLDQYLIASRRPPYKPEDFL